MSAIGAVGGGPLAPAAGAHDPVEGHQPDGLVKKQLKRWANDHLDEVVAEAVAAHGLDAQETTQLRSALTGVKDAKLREYWQRRGPAESFGLLGRTAAVSGVMIAIGLSSPAALIPAAIGVAVGLGGRAAVVYHKLGHALEGRAAVELSKIEKARGVEPAPLDAVGRLSQRMAAASTARHVQTYELEGADADKLAGAVEDARTTKLEELRSRLPIEVGTLAATAVATGAATAALGLLTAAGAVVLGASVVVAAGAAVGFALLKLRSAIDGSAHAVVEELAPHAPEGSPLREVAEVEGAREKKALESAARIRDKVAKDYRLTPAQTAELDRRLVKTAHQKRKELWDHRLGATMATPLARGSAIAGVAGALAGDPAVAVGTLIGSVAEAAVSAGLLVKQLDSALEGVAYAYVKSLRAGT